MNQGDTLDMIVYGIGILPLICELCTAHTNATQPWYAYNVGNGGMFDALQDNMSYFLVRGPPRGYFPEPTKIILVVFPRNVQQSEEHFSRMGLQLVTGIRFLGGFIGDQNS